MLTWRTPFVELKATEQGWVRTVILGQRGGHSPVLHGAALPPCMRHKLQKRWSNEHNASGQENKMNLGHIQKTLVMEEESRTSCGTDRR